MNTNLIIGVIAVIVLVAGAWFFTNKTQTAKTTETPAAVDTNTYTDTTPTTEVPATTTTTATASSSSSVDTPKNAVTFNVAGSNHTYDVKTMTVKKGQTVTVNFTNEGGFHDWVLDEFTGARTPRIQAGQSASVTFVADKAGTFEYYCSVGNHRALGMVGKFVVTE